MHRLMATCRKRCRIIFLLQQTRAKGRRRHHDVHRGVYVSHLSLSAGAKMLFEFITRQTHSSATDCEAKFGSVSDIFRERLPTLCARLLDKMV